MNCSVCNEAYNESENKPLTLNPCGHCFCLACLNSLKNQACPKCRAHIKSKIINFAILDMLNPSAASNTQSTVATTAAQQPVHEISPERKERIFKSLENVLAELDDLKKSLAKRK